MKTYLNANKALLIIAALLAVALIFAVYIIAPSGIALADGENGQSAQPVQNEKASKAYSAAIVVGLAAFAGALAMGITIMKSNEGIARQPEAAGKIRTNMMLGLVFIETVIIYALVVAILIIFVL